MTILGLIYTTFIPETVVVNKDFAVKDVCDQCLSTIQDGFK